MAVVRTSSKPGGEPGLAYAKDSTRYRIMGTLSADPDDPGNAFIVTDLSQCQHSITRETFPYREMRLGR